MCKTEPTTTDPASSNQPSKEAQEYIKKNHEGTKELTEQHKNKEGIA